MFFIYIVNSGAQELTLSEAIETGLKSNFDILISRNDSSIAAIGNTPGAAGMLPQLNIVGGENQSLNNTVQHTSTGFEIEKSGVKASSYNLSANVTWTLFDGMKMFVERDRLGKIAGLSTVNLHAKIEDEVSKIMIAYYSMMKEQQLLKIARDVLEIAEEKLRITEAKLKAGSIPEVEVMQAKLDLNEKRTALARQESVYANAKVSLNQEMGRNAETDFKVSDSLPVVYKPSYEELKKTSMENNTSLRAYQINSEIARLNLKELKSFQYPKVGLGLNYGLAQTNNQAGLYLLNKNIGLTYGLNFTYNIFDGYNLKNKIRMADVTINSSDLQFHFAQSLVAASLLSAFNTFTADLKILKMEEENSELARSSIEISRSRYRLGKSSLLEFNDAGNKYQDALTRMVSSRYDVKASEVALMKLNGKLVSGINP